MSEVERLRAALVEIAETNDLAITSNIMCAAVMRSIAREALSAIAMETRKGGDVKQAPSRSDDSAGRRHRTDAATQPHKED